MQAYNFRPPYFRAHWAPLPREDWRMDLIESETAQYEHYLAAELTRLKAAKLVEVLDQLCAKTLPDCNTKPLFALLAGQLAEQADAHQGILAHIPPMYRRSPETTLVIDKLSGTPELLELILTYLDNTELLRCMQVNKMFNEAITSSAKLQRKLGLRADPFAKMYFPTANFWFSDLFCSAEAVEPKGDQEGTNLMRVYVAVDTFPRSFSVGKRCRSMLICQPPLLSIDAYSSCCAGPRFWRHRTGAEVRPPAETIRSATGITVGDILDATTRLKETHRLCPDASPFDHNEQGFVNAQISFETAINAAADDPLFVRERDKMHEDRKKHRERVARQHRLDAYAAAKRAARDRGEAIPTLAEFEVASGMSAAPSSSNAGPSNG